MRNHGGYGQTIEDLLDQEGGPVESGVSLVGRVILWKYLSQAIANSLWKTEHTCVGNLIRHANNWNENISDK